MSSSSGAPDTPPRLAERHNLATGTPAARTRLSSDAPAPSHQSSTFEIEPPGTPGTADLPKNNPALSVPPGSSSGGGGGGGLFGRFFDKINEAVGATRELLADGELRRKAVPFVLAEGSRAWQELQKGLSRNAAALGRQLQNTAAGQFSSYVARLLDRTAYQPQRGRAAQYNQPVSVWIGSTVYRDMPQEIRTRFWIVLLEHPSLVSMLRPISSRTLLGDGGDGQGASAWQKVPSASTPPLPQQPQQEGEQGAQQGEQQHQELQQQDAAAAQEAQQDGKQTEQRQEGEAAEAGSHGGCRAEAGPAIVSDVAGKSLTPGTEEQVLLPEPLGEQPQPPAAADGDEARSAPESMPQDHHHQQQQQEGGEQRTASASSSQEAPATLTPGAQQDDVPPHQHDHKEQEKQAPQGAQPAADTTTATATSTTPAAAAPPPAPAATAVPTRPSFVAEPEDEEHAAEDEVLDFLESKQPRQQPNASGNAPASSTAASKGAPTSAAAPPGALRRALISKVASVVDKGKEVVAAARDRAHSGSGGGGPGSGGSGGGGGAQAGGSQRRPSQVEGPSQHHSSSQQQQQQLMGTPFGVASQATQQHQQGGGAAGAKAGGGQHQGVPAGVRAAAAQAVLSGVGADSEWELLDTPSASASQELAALNGGAGMAGGQGGADGAAGGGAAAAGAAGGAEDNARSLIHKTLERHLSEAQESSSPLEQVWSLMTSLPWDEGKGLVLDTPEDCRYLTLNEMKAGQEEVDDVILRDVHRTFPEHPMFKDQAGQMALFRLLKAYSLHDLEVAYCQGMAFAAGVMLMYLPEEPAFRLYCQLMTDEGPNLRRLYLPGLEELKAELARFEQLLQVTQPALQAHLEDFGIPPVLYVSQWLMTVYASPFPPLFSAELIDIMVQDGHDAIMMRCALTIMDELAPALLRLHDFEQLLTYIKVTPMEWDTQHLQQLLARAVSHTWCTNAPPSEHVLTDSASLQALAALTTTDSTAANATGTAALTTAGAAAGDGVGDGAGADAARSQALTSETGERASADGRGSGGAGALGAAGASLALSGGSELLEQLLSGAAPHMIDAEELQLDQEIAQMVRDLKLKVPQGGGDQADS